MRLDVIQDQLCKIALLHNTCIRSPVIIFISYSFWDELSLLSLFKYYLAVYLFIYLYLCPVICYLHLSCMTYSTRHNICGNAQVTH